jgi:SAM-dependent methyltransferase
MRPSWLRNEITELADWFARQRDEESRAFDATWGTETTRFDLGNYEPTLPSVFASAMDALDVAPEDWSFVDLGSGKGRAVLLASQRPFKRAIGIEWREALHRVAEANLVAFTERGGPVCEVFFFRGDATTHPLPEGPLVVFLYNPFPDHVVAKVLDRLVGRELRLVYVTPDANRVVISRGLVQVAFGGTDPWDWCIFRPG